MKILMISPQFRPIVGGYERAAERLSYALLARDHSVTLITERRNSLWPKYEIQENLIVHRWWCLYRRHLHLLTSLFGLAVLLVKYGRAFDIWHVHQYGSHATLVIVFSKVLRRPVVLKLTSSGSQGLDECLRSMRFGWLHCWLHRSISACIAVSEETYREAIDFGIPEDLVLRTTNGIDTVEFHPPTTEEREVAIEAINTCSDFLAVAIGRLASVKNPLGLLEAWSHALRYLPPSARLVWVGEGPQRREVEVAIENLHLSNRVILVGHSNDVYSWYAAADVFLLPSQTEGMANSLLEAMACGLPSVSTAVSGSTELLVRTCSGLVVPVGDMLAFAEAIVNLAVNTISREEMGGRARLTAVNHSLDNVAGKVETLYENLITNY